MKSISKTSLIQTVRSRSDKSFYDYEDNDYDGDDDDDGSDDNIQVSFVFKPRRPLMCYLFKISS